MKYIFVLFNKSLKSAVYIFKKKLIAKESLFGSRETVDGTVYTTVYTF